MGKQLKMDAETGKFGAPKKFYRLEILVGQDNKITVNEDTQGFNVYEVVGLLEAIQANNINKAVKQQ
jgi:hypothetical protein